MGICEPWLWWPGFLFLGAGFGRDVMGGHAMPLGDEGEGGAECDGAVVMVAMQSDSRGGGNLT